MVRNWLAFINQGQILSTVKLCLSKGDFRFYFIFLKVIGVFVVSETNHSSRSLPNFILLHHDHLSHDLFFFFLPILFFVRYYYCCGLNVYFIVFFTFYVRKHCIWFQIIWNMCLFKWTCGSYEIAIILNHLMDRILVSLGASLSGSVSQHKQILIFLSFWTSLFTK